MPDISIGDRVQLRKKHPCGSDQWIVTRATGTDIGLRCGGCDRRILLPRGAFLKQLKQVIASGGDPPAKDKQ
jgi:hypothetical protein